MKLNAFCTMRLHYSGDFRLARPYGGEAGIGWGVGEGTVTGAAVTGTARWSNHPSRRGDGAMLPDARGVIATADDGVVFFELTGRTVFVERDGEEIGRQLLLVLFESEDARYAWLNQTVCVGEGVIDPVALVIQIEVSTLQGEN